jgi:hypothetical protein
MVAAAAAVLGVVAFWLLPLAMRTSVQGSSVDPLAGIVVGAFVAVSVYLRQRRS